MTSIKDRIAAAVRGGGIDVVQNTDDQIRKMQQHGEKYGYDDSLKRMINDAREYASGVSNDVQSQGGARVYRQTGAKMGSGALPYQRETYGSNVIGQGEGLSLIAQLLGKYRGEALANENAAMRVGADRQYANNQSRADTITANYLEQAFNEMMNKDRAEQELLREQLKMQKQQMIDSRPKAPDRGGYRGPPKPEPIPQLVVDDFGGRGGRGGNGGNGGGPSFNDPFASARAAAIAAALRQLPRF